MKRFDLAIVIAATALVAGGAGFALGHYSAAKTTSASTQNGSQGGDSQDGPGGRAGGGFRNGQRPVFGTVASVTGDTVTVTDRGGNTRTVTLTSSTSYTSGDGSSANQSGITQGVTIAAFGTTDSSGNVTATRVTINPSFGGGNGGGGTMGGQPPSGGSSSLN